MKRLRGDSAFDAEMPAFKRRAASASAAAGKVTRRATLYRQALASARRLDRGPSMSYQRLHQPMRGFLGPAGDQKYVDVANASYGMDTTGSITHVSIVPQGTTVNQREGKAFQITSVQIRGQSLSDLSTTTAAGHVYLVWDYQPNKALAGITDVLDAVTTQSFTKRENASRFKILMSRVYVFAGNATVPVDGTEIYPVEEFIRVPKSCSIATCTVADTTGAIGNRVTGALLLITVGNKAIAGNLGASYVVTLRVNFKDI